METFNEPTEILKFWFRNNEYQKWWFISNSKLDQEITDKYYGQMCMVFDGFDPGNYSHTQANKIITDIILLDQFSRNIARTKPSGSIDIVAYTKKAEVLSKIWIDRKYYLTEPIAHTAFAFLPIRHSKNLIEINKLIPILEEIKFINNNNSNQIYLKFYTHTLRALKIT